MFIDQRLETQKSDAQHLIAAKNSVHAHLMGTSALALESRKSLIHINLISSSIKWMEKYREQAPRN